MVRNKPYNLPYGPMYLDIFGQPSEEIALSIMAEIVAARNRGTE